jgi:hypothetical protein
MSSVLLLKLVLTPTLIALVTLAGRRWGHGAAGLLAGLPITGGPILFFIAVEQGAGFAQRTAVAALTGLIAFTGFCVAYTWSSRVAPWFLSLPIGYLAYAAVGWPVTRWHPPVGFAALAGAGALILGAQCMPRATDPVRAEVPPPAWELPARMVAAGVVVLAVTGLAAWLGAGWSGVLTVFPTAATALGTFVHHAAGPAAATRLLRGLTVGMLGVAGFMIALSLTLGRLGLGAAFACGVTASLISLATLLGVLRLGRAASAPR